MKKLIYYVVGILLVLLITGNVFTYPLQHLFIFRPDVLEQDHQFAFDSAFEEVDLKTADGGKINALHFKDPKAKGVILYFHGNAGNLVRWGELNDQFRAQGYDLFIMDFRGFGKSTGKLSERLFYQDAEQCYAYVAEQYPADEIIIYGRSMGSGPASYLASQVEAKHVILETPFHSIKDLFYAYYPFLPRMFVFKFSFSNYQHLKKVDAPITIFHGSNDFLVPQDGSLKLKEVLKPGDAYVSIAGGTHNDLFIFAQYQDTLSEILR